MAFTRIVFFVLVLTLAVSAPVLAVSKKKKTEPQLTWQYGVVARIIDGDTVQLKDGTRVRMLDINTPELSHYGRPEEPFAAKAKERTEELVLGKFVALRVGKKPFDDYGRLLAHVVFDDGKYQNQWLNGMLVSEGLATVYTFADNRVYPQPLLALERDARKAQRGFWTLPRWQVREADTCCDGEDIGRFVLVRGVVKNVSRGEKVWYLNFGDDYRTDFTVEIPLKDYNKNFKKVGLADLAAAYKGKVLEVRGVLKPINGVLVRATHPDVLRVLSE